MTDLNNAVLLITGGTGSFGKAFITAVLTKFKPKKVIVFSRDELKQHEMQQDPFFREHAATMRYFLGDVRDVDRLERAFREVDFVIHAAALKHVPAAEYNPFECIRTNVIGAENVVQAALRCGVKKVLALSTDKAANPINLYGASKLAADKIFVAANNLSGSIGSRFSVVRYGNVLGSRGSVVPYFQALIDRGETTLPITDTRMTRFWITLEQGIDFVTMCLDTMRGGETFIPKLPSMNMVDLAKGMLPGCDIKEIGIRPGEKLHEVMVPRDDARMTLEFDRHFIIQPMHDYWEASAYLAETGGKPVDEEFEYSSETNDVWLSPLELQEMLADG